MLHPEQRAPSIPADAMTVDEVVAVATRLSWLGLTHPRRAFYRRHPPAFGVAAWLAHLPPEPFHGERDDWQRQR